MVLGLGVTQIFIWHIESLSICSQVDISLRWSGQKDMIGITKRSP